MFTQKIKNPDEFEKITSGIQNIILSVATIIGGIWALLVFTGTYQIQSAAAQLSKAEGEKTNIELNIDLNVVKNTDKSQRYIIGSAALINKGTERKIFNIPDKSITLSSVSFEETADKMSAIKFTVLSKTDMFTTPEGRRHQAESDPKTTNSATFAFQITQPGLYFVSVEIEAPDGVDKKMTGVRDAKFIFVE